jgi:hypothetical protein
MGQQKAFSLIIKKLRDDDIDAMSDRGWRNINLQK